jgi:hypothetical protein
MYTEGGFSRRVSVADDAIAVGLQESGNVGTVSLMKTKYLLDVQAQSPSNIQNRGELSNARHSLKQYWQAKVEAREMKLRHGRHQGM